MTRILNIYYQAMGYLSKEDPDVFAEYAMGFPHAPKAVQDGPDNQDVKIARASPCPTQGRDGPCMYSTMSKPFQLQEAVSPSHLSGPGGVWSNAGIIKLFKALDQVANGPADQKGRFYDTFDAALQ